MIEGHGENYLKYRELWDASREMKLVTDSGADMIFDAERRNAIDVEVVPFLKRMFRIHLTVYLGCIPVALWTFGVFELGPLISCVAVILWFLICRYGLEQYIYCSACNWPVFLVRGKEGNSRFLPRIQPPKSCENCDLNFEHKII